MEIKINREIREYTEAMYFGLSLRQFICAVLACGVAVGLYFLLRPHMGMETVSWVCMLGAAPFAAIGFIKYHGMTAEKFLWVWIKSEILMPKYLVFHPENLYYELTKDEIRKQEKEAMGKHVKNTKNRHAADKEKFKIPKSVQQAIPIQTIWKDGIFLVGKNKYAKTYRLTKSGKK